MDDDEMTRSDAETVAWAMAGDRASFAIVVHEHGRAVHAYLARRAGRQVADDLLTEVWLRAWRSRGSYEIGWAGPRPWLYGIARNVLRAHWRGRADRTGPVLQLAEDPWPAVDDRLDAGRLRHALAAALAALGEEHREALLLVAWEQLTPTEVAAALGLPPSTVRSRLHRARRLLQRAVDTSVDRSGPTCPNPIYQEA
ncbi:MAG: RNA polymerase sigma factor [Acidimicrobiales bacterium]